MKRITFKAVDDRIMQYTVSPLFTLGNKPDRSREVIRPLGKVSRIRQETEHLELMA